MEEKTEKYELLCNQVKGLVEGEGNLMSVLANVAAAMHDTFPSTYFWVGFYLVKDGVLQLGPFQGPVACYRIPYGKGVCGSAWKKRHTLIVDDVEQFPGHIACSSLSRSEIVVPIIGIHGEMIGVIDIDSKELCSFDKTDQEYLEKIAAIVADFVNNLYFCASKT